MIGREGVPFEKGIPSRTHPRKTLIHNIDCWIEGTMCVWERIWRKSFLSEKKFGKEIRKRKGISAPSVKKPNTQWIYMKRKKDRVEINMKWEGVSFNRIFFLHPCKKNFGTQ